MKLIKKLSVKKIMEFCPCNKEEEIEEFRIKAGLPETCSVLEFARCKHKNKGDIIYCLLQKGIIPDMEVHTLGVRFAWDALMAEREAGREPHLVLWNALRIKKRWLKGKATDAELAAAKTAAWAAGRAAGSAVARSAGSAVAWAAGSAAARAAARAAGSAAASAAAWAAGSAVARAAARAAAREKQLKQIIKVLKKYHN